MSGWEGRRSAEKPQVRCFTPLMAESTGNAYTVRGRVTYSPCSPRAQIARSRCAQREANGRARTSAKIGFERVKPRLFQLLRFIDQHHRNIVENGIDTAALRAKESVLCSGRCNRNLAFRADKNLEQFFGNHLFRKF